MRLTRFALVAAVLTSTGCYTYQVTDPGALPVGQEVRVRLSPEGAERLQQVRLTEERLMEGKVLENGGSQVVVETAVNRLNPVTGGRVLTQRLSVPTSDIREVEIKVLNKPRTAAAAGLAAVVLGYIVAGQLQDGGGSGSTPGPGGVEAPVFRIPLLGLPFSF